MNIKKYVKILSTFAFIIIYIIALNIKQHKIDEHHISHYKHYKSVEHTIPPLIGNITSFFGYRINPITYNLDFHPAIDICAPNQSYIRAILPGTVKETGNSNIYGNYIIISHKNNIESKYCHCEKILKKKQHSIKQGEIISTVGHTGFATGDHLHLEIKINNINIDPLLLINLN